jgi:hypothetical protein
MGGGKEREVRAYYWSVDGEYRRGSLVKVYDLCVCSKPRLDVVMQQSERCGVATMPPLSFFLFPPAIHSLQLYLLLPSFLPSTCLVLSCHECSAVK